MYIYSSKWVKSFFTTYQIVRPPHSLPSKIILIPISIKVRNCIVQFRVSTYSDDDFVRHFCFGFLPPLACSWLVNEAQISAKVQIFQFVRITRHTPEILNLCHVIRVNCAAGCLSRLCINLACQSLMPKVSLVSGVNAPLDCPSQSPDLNPI